MDLTETIHTLPVTPRKSVRTDEWANVTSGRAGKIIPLAYAPMLREDRVARGAARIKFEMEETVKTLMNSIGVTVYAHFVPFLAFDRFNGLDALNRAYRKEPENEGEDPIPFFTSMPYNRTAPLFHKLGIHGADGDVINAAVVEAYNVLVNFRRKARSENIALRETLDTSLAEAFWRHPAMRHIKPSFDEAMIDGYAELSIIDSNLPVRGLAAAGSGSGGTRNVVNHPPGQPQTVAGANTRELFWDTTAADGVYQVFAEMGVTNARVSLAAIERAKKTAAFAALRKKYNGIDDEYIIDLLMDGIRVPDAQLGQPILLDRKSTIMGYAKRYATDGANLSQSVTTGETFVDLYMRTPAMNTGGIILVTAEIVPEQLYERQQDHFLYTLDPATLPEATTDALREQPVDVVQNKHVDVQHTDPTATFGYAPMNHVWDRHLKGVGGKYMRRVDDTFDEDRQRIWGVEVADPTLTDDFYIVGDLHHNVFHDTLSDPFQIFTRGRLQIVGNTQFGPRLHENSEDYTKLLEQAERDRIEQDAAQ